MQVECAWCGCIVGEKDGLGRSGTTSGICEACFAIVCGNPPPGEAVAEPAANRPRGTRLQVLRSPVMVK